MSDKKRRLVYQSEGVDGMQIVCGGPDIDELDGLCNLIRGDAQALRDDRSDQYPDGITIHLTVKEMTDEEVAAIQEV